MLKEEFGTQCVEATRGWKLRIEFETLHCKI